MNDKEQIDQHHASQCLPEGMLIPSASAQEEEGVHPNQEQPTAYRFQGSAAIEIERPYIHHRLPYIGQDRLFESSRPTEQWHEQETGGFGQQQSKGGHDDETCSDIQESGQELLQHGGRKHQVGRTLLLCVHRFQNIGSREAASKEKHTEESN